MCSKKICILEGTVLACSKTTCYLKGLYEIMCNLRRFISNCS